MFNPRSAAKCCGNPNIVVDHRESATVCRNCGVSRQILMGGSSFAQSARPLVHTSRRERNVRKLIERIADRLQTSERVAGTATAYCRALFQSEVKKVKKDELIAAIMVAMSARHHRLPYTFKELSDGCNRCSRKEICRGVKVYARKFTSVVAYDRTHMNYSAVLPRMCSALGFEWEQQKAATRVLNRMLKHPENSATNPLTLVAVSLAKVDPSRVVDISMVCGVSKHTILKCEA